MSVLGFQGVLYINTGTEQTPVWVEVGCVRDLTLTMDSAPVDVTCRGSNGYRRQRGGLQEVGVEFQLIYQKGDTESDLIRQDWWGRGTHEYLIYSGDRTASDNEGVRGTFEVLTLTRNENLEEAFVYDVALVIPDGVTDPAWVTGEQPPPP